jgi:predicted DNA-binding transcriptional regulator YafY
LGEDAFLESKKGCLLARNEQLIRQHKILQVLERRRYGATLEDLRNTIVEELGLTGLHVRSIRRDLEALQAAGMNIITEDLDTGRVWKLSRVDKGLHKVTITSSELIALSMGRDLLLPLVGTTFWQGIEAFWSKLREQMPAGVWDHYQKYRRTLRVLGVPAKSYERQEGILKSVNRAIDQHRILEAEYESTNKPLSTRYLEPYGLALYQGSIYVVAMEEGKDVDKDPEDRLRHWKLDRFAKATALDRWYDFDEQIDLEKHLGQSVGIFSGDEPATYKIWLSKIGARWIQEDPWHAHQKLEFQDDGTCILHVPAYQPMEIIPHVLRFGDDAQLLEPVAARKEMKRIVDAMATMYK